MTSYGSDDESEMAQLADAIDVSLSQLLPSTETPTSPSASSIGTSSIDPGDTGSEFEAPVRGPVSLESLVVATRNQGSRKRTRIHAQLSFSSVCSAL